MDKKIQYSSVMKSGMIVIVDDEQMVTSAFKTLLKLEGFTNCVAFNNPVEAVDFLKNNKPDIIISDFIMPEMNGLEFLSEAKKLYPDVSKILLTGYADKENAIKAINEIGLYKYIEKPWDNDDLIITVQNGIERSNLIDKLHEKISELEVAKKELEKYSHNLEELVAEKTADLVQAHSKLKSIITNCADGIIISDKKGHIEQANPATENLSGLSESNLLNTNLSELVFGKNLVEVFNDCIEDGETVLRDCYLINRLSEKQIPVEISFAMIATEEIENNTPNQKFVGVIRDVSVQKETDRLRDDFIATLTHDMRTPLTAAIQTLNFFLDGTVGNLNERQHMLLSTMKLNNEGLLGLVNSLLTVYKFDAGKVELVKSNFNAKELVMQRYEELKPLADKKNLDFKVTFEPDDDLIITADRQEIGRVIANLCGNAVNYTNVGGKIEIIVKEQAGDFLFSVTDTGNGIPKEDIPHLFKRFSQGTSKKRSTGTGLGLYLSRQIVEAHGGKIWLESKINQGSEFSFILTDVVAKPNKERLTV
ncbi:MAG: ATP-binding protein [Candidatus Gastranaerophilaceae bacterium]